MKKEKKHYLRRFGIYALIFFFISHFLLVLGKIVESYPFSLLDATVLLLQAIVLVAVIMGFIRKMMWAWYLALVFYIILFFHPIIKSLMGEYVNESSIGYFLLVPLLAIISISLKRGYFFPKKEYVYRLYELIFDIPLILFALALIVFGLNLILPPNLFI